MLIKPCYLASENAEDFKNTNGGPWSKEHNPPVRTSSLCRKRRVQNGVVFFKNTQDLQRKRSILRQDWQCSPLIPALGKQRQTALCVLRQPGRDPVSVLQTFLFLVVLHMDQERETSSWKGKFPQVSNQQWVRVPGFSVRTTDPASCWTPYYNTHSSAPGLDRSLSPSTLKHLSHKKIYVLGRIFFFFFFLQNWGKSKPREKHFLPRTSTTKKCHKPNFQKINILQLDFFLIRRM